MNGLAYFQKIKVLGVFWTKEFVSKDNVIVVGFQCWVPILSKTKMFLNFIITILYDRLINHESDYKLLS